MPTSAKALLQLLVIVCVFGSIYVWADPEGGWPWRMGFAPAGLGALFALMWASRKRDKVRDYLHEILRAGYFERDGFCFGVSPRVADNRCFLDVYYQNRYADPCHASVVLKPSRQFFLNRRDLTTLTIGIPCPGAGFGRASVPWAVPEAYQGKPQSLDGAPSVEYPQGRGELLRYREGVRVGSANVSAWKVVATVAAAATGNVGMSKPATLKITLPSRVFETMPDASPLVVEIL